jgi:hypothetical protein
MKYFLDTSSGLANPLFRDGLWLHVPLKNSVFAIFYVTLRYVLPTIRLCLLSALSRMNSAGKHSGTTIIVFRDLMTYILLHFHGIISVLYCKDEGRTFLLEFRYISNKLHDVTFHKTIICVVTAFSTSAVSYVKDFWRRNLANSPPTSVKVRCECSYNSNTSILYRKRIFLSFTSQTFFAPIIDILLFLSLLTLHFSRLVKGWHDFCILCLIRWLPRLSSILHACQSKVNPKSTAVFLPYFRRSSYTFTHIRYSTNLGSLCNFAT